MQNQHVNFIIGIFHENRDITHTALEEANFSKKCTRYGTYGI